MENYNIKDDISKYIDDSEYESFSDRFKKRVFGNLWFQILVTQSVFILIIYSMVVAYIYSKDYLNSAVPFDADIAAITIFVIMFAIMMIAWCFMMEIIIKPVYKIKNSIADIERGNLFKSIPIEGENELWEFARNFNKMANELAKQKMESSYQYEERMKAVELKNSAQMMSMENQIDPGFIRHVVGYISENRLDMDADSLKDITSRLFSILEYVGPENTKESTLSTELEWIENYLYLQKLLYKNSFEYKIQMSDGISEWPCSKLFLLPLIENSITHGFEGINENAKILINAELFQNRAVLTVWDNGNGIDSEGVKKIERHIKRMRELDFSVDTLKMTLYNMISKLFSFYGERLDIKINSVKGEGTSFVIYLPYPNKFLWMKNQ